MARSITSGTSAWPNEMVADLSTPPQVRQAGSSSPARTRASARSIGASSPQSQHTTRRIVPCTSITLSGRGAGPLVQLVDVLGDDGEQPALALQLGDGEVTGVRPGVPGRRVEAVLPRRLPHLRVAEVVLQRGRLLGRGVLGPHAVRAAEVGDARVGRDAGTRQHHDRAERRATQPCARSTSSSSTATSLTGLIALTADRKAWRMARDFPTLHASPDGPERPRAARMLEDAMPLPHPLTSTCGAPSSSSPGPTRSWRPSATIHAHPTSSASTSPCSARRSRSSCGGWPTGSRRGPHGFETDAAAWPSRSASAPRRPGATARSSGRWSAPCGSAWPALTPAGWPCAAGCRRSASARLTELPAALQEAHRAWAESEAA